jgi:hypothetical protein
MRKLIYSACLVSFLICRSFAAQEAAKGEDPLLDDMWNATPNDINNLLKSMVSMMDVSYNMEIKSLAQVDPDPGRNPVLFRSGHYNYSYTEAQRKKLREYMLAGGMVVFNTGLGSAPFYRSTVRELKEIFPEQPLQRLTADHPIFHSYYEIGQAVYQPAVAKSGYRGNEPYFDAVEINCRVVALLSRWCMAVGWEDLDDPEHQAYKPKCSKMLGVNIFSYASSMRAWAKNAAQSMKFDDADKTTADKMAMVQVVYDGVWKTRHAGLSVLLLTFNQRTSIPVKYALKDMRLTDPMIFNAPLLYLTGHEFFTMGKSEAVQLKKYLENGGFLFAEACCGRKGFDMAFRQLMTQILPAAPLKAIPAGNPLFQSPNDVKSLGVTPILAQELGKGSIPPHLEGCEIIPGQYSVIYSPFGMAGGWEMSQSPYAKAYDDVGSQKLGQNILMYAITH